MSEEQIINAIANACEDDRLYFQVIIQDSTLHIYINRPIQAKLDYQQLKEQIYTAIIELFGTVFEKIWLYCRVLGEVEPDWQAVLEIDAVGLISDEMTSMVESISTAVKTTNSIVEKIERELKTTESFADDAYWEIDDLPTTADDNSEASETQLEWVDPELDLSKYCFIRNKRLLYTILPAPEPRIARLIDTFDWFDPSIKRSQLPILEAYFENLIVPDTNSFELEVQIWWAKIEHLDSETRHMFAIWLSRYCLNTEQTISIVKKDATQVSTTEAEARSQTTSGSPTLDPDSTTAYTSSQSSSEGVSQTDSNSQVKLGWLTNLTRSIYRLLQIFK